MYMTRSEEIILRILVTCIIICMLHMVYDTLKPIFM